MYLKSHFYIFLIKQFDILQNKENKIAADNQQSKKLTPPATHTEMSVTTKDGLQTLKVSPSKISTKEDMIEFQDRNRAEARVESETENELSESFAELNIEKSRQMSSVSPKESSTNHKRANKLSLPKSVSSSCVEISSESLMKNGNSNIRKSLGESDRGSNPAKKAESNHSSHDRVTDKIITSTDEIVQENKAEKLLTQSRNEFIVRKDQQSEHLEKTTIKSKADNCLAHGNVDNLKADKSPKGSSSHAFIDLTDDNTTDSFEKIAAKNNKTASDMAKPVSSLLSNGGTSQQWRDNSDLQTASQYLQSQKFHLQQDVTRRDICLEKLKKQKVILQLDFLLLKHKMKE